MEGGDWLRLRYTIAEAPDILRANAERIRNILAVGAEEPEPLEQALTAIEKKLADLDAIRDHHGRHEP